MTLLEYTQGARGKLIHEKTLSRKSRVGLLLINIVYLDFRTILIWPEGPFTDYLSFCNSLISLLLFLLKILLFEE
jgi:hypothetical protein